MALIANLQYGWTLFVDPIHKAHGWEAGQIQWAFSIFVALETWLTPVQGWIVDNLGTHGPKLMVAAGGVLIAIGWALNSVASSLALLYIAAALSGIGAGGIYATCVGNAVKWFPDRRGLAVGLTAAGFGAGAAVTVIPVRMLIAARGYETTFLIFAVIQGAVIFLLSWLLRPPMPGEVPAIASPKFRQAALSSTPEEVAQSPVFWLLYLMFVAVSASGLMATAQLALIAKSYGIADSALLVGTSTLTVALIVDNVMNGLARPFFGWSRTGLDARTLWPWPSDSEAWPIGCSALSARPHGPSCCLPASSSSPGARSSASSLRLVRILSVRNTRPPMRACSIRPKEPRRFSFPSPICCRPR
jgi:OFA family oxalate/formate antiporter-like MFS transporter